MPALNVERHVRRLRDAGFSDAQAHALVRLLADVRTPGFEPGIARQDLLGAGFTGRQADVLIEGTVRAFAPA